MYDHTFSSDSSKDLRGDAAAQAKRQAPQSQTKLVLIFFVLLVGTYTVIIQHKFHLPDAGGLGKSHRKHLRMEFSSLQEQFQSHTMNFSRKAVGSRANVGQMLESHGVKHLAGQQQSARATAGAGTGGGAAAAGSGNSKRAEAVKAAMVHAWAGYEKYAWGMDELMPTAQMGKNSFAGMGATLLDGLSTLWIMGLKEQFAHGRDWVATNLTFTTTQEISLFETNIRVVGGLLSAYDLSGDKVFLKRVTEIVDLMLPAMDNSTTGIPANSIILGQPSSSYRTTAALAECGSLQLEWSALSERTGNSVYAEKSQKIFRALHEVYPDQGLIPTSLTRATGAGPPSFSVGAMADSFYEYLLKLWLLGGQKARL